MTTALAGERAAFRALGAIVLVLLLALGGCQTADLFAASSVGVSSAASSRMAAIRGGRGLAPLRADGRLEAAARQQARYMADARRMTHDTGWRKDFATRMSANGVGGPAAENIARGRMDVERVMGMWMYSQSHRRNMLNARFSRFGLAYAENPDGERFWVMVLGG